MHIIIIITTWKLCSSTTWVLKYNHQVLHLWL